MSQSNIRQVTLSPLTLDTTGRYRCEVGPSTTTRPHNTYFTTTYMYIPIKGNTYSAVALYSLHPR